MQCGAAENEDGDIRPASYDKRVVRERTKKMQQQQRNRQKEETQQRIKKNHKRKNGSETEVGKLF